MIEIEPYLVEIIGQLALMRVPITCKEGLSLANSIIKNTTCEESVAEWKAKFCRSVDNNPRRKMSLGIGYWRGFMKRNGHLIKAKKGVKFDAKRADWCTHRNFEEMYAKIYQKMVEKGIAMLNKSPEQWTVPQLKTMVKWFKRDGDAALPLQDIMKLAIVRRDLPLPCHHLLKWVMNTMMTMALSSMKRRFDSLPCCMSFLFVR